jgi:hypothetical protein
VACEKQNSNADRYRETAEEIRLAAERTRSPEIRIELFDPLKTPWDGGADRMPMSTKAT